MGNENRYVNIVRAILARPWAIDQQSLAWAAICDVLALRAEGGFLSDAEIRARLEAAKNGPRAGGGRQGKGATVAVIPMYGVISPRQDMLSATSGGTTAEGLLSDFRAALADPEVDGIVFDVDSPGGSVAGIDELASEIRAARGQKPIAAVANHTAASAAYWAIAGVDELNVTPSAMVGSIGVFAAHQDMSAAFEQKGVKTTLLSAGKYKVEGNQFEALGDEARAAIQADVDAFYSKFVHAVAKGRGVPVETVRGGFGEGRTVLADQAVRLGMADQVATLDETIRRVARGAVGGTPQAAAGDVTHVAVASQPDTDALASGRPFSERLELASALAADLREQARKRADLRAEEGRELSDATRDGLRSLADSLREIADEPDVEAAAEAPTQSARRRIDLEVLEAATRGGYRLDPAL